MFRAHVCSRTVQWPSVPISWGSIWQKIAPAWGWASRPVLPNPIWSEALGRAAFGLAKNSSAWAFRDLNCDDILSSCALMRFFTVGHQVCGFDLSASSTQLKTIFWPRPPEIQRVFVVTFFVGSLYCQSARLFMEWVARMTMDFYKKSSWGRFYSQLDCMQDAMDDVIVLDLVLGRSEVVTPKLS